MLFTSIGKDLGPLMLSYSCIGNSECKRGGPVRILIKKEKEEEIVLLSEG